MKTNISKYKTVWQNLIITLFSKKTGIIFTPGARLMEMLKTLKFVKS